MEKNKKKLLLASISGLAVFGIILGNHLLKEKCTLLSPITTRSQTLAIYIQNENSDTGYSKSESAKFPTEGYILNLDKSTCTNEGELSQDLSTKKILLRIKHKGSCSLYFDKEIKNEALPTLTKLGKIVKEGNPNFANPAKTNETIDGLYAMEDDYGMSYYYRGSVTDNYVKFAGFYWRIIRINGDGSLRIIYDGTEAHGNGASSIDRLVLQSIAWNTTNYNDAKYVGYMYGGANGVASTSKSGAQTNKTNTYIKTAIENWYKTNIVDNGYDSYVSDNIFCNDRTIPGKEITGWSSDTELGYGKFATGYGAFSRMMTGNNSASISPKGDPTPKFTCENKNDAFTKEDTEKGNGKLGQKVGMITADEIVAAGSGKYNTNNGNYYLYKGSWYWSYSPYSYGSDAYIFIVYNGGALSHSYVIGVGGMVPVINLSTEYVSTMSGEGTAMNPFEVK